MYPEHEADRQALILFFEAVGTDKTGHSGRNLTVHLLGVFDMLAEAGCARHVCLGGALHSIYGTNAFRFKSLPEKARPFVAKLFGEKAENLAALFSSLERPRVLEAGYVDCPPSGTVHDLRLIEAANLLEQGSDLTRYPVINRVWQAQREQANPMAALAAAADDFRAGKTAQQMLDAPQGAIFVWKDFLCDYPRNLAKKLGREDLRIVSKDWMLHKVYEAPLMAPAELIIDHRAELSPAMVEEARAIMRGMM